MRIFLSSPYRDLQTLRGQLKEALASHGHDIVSMEEFGSSGLPPLDTCLAALRQCDVCIVLIGYRYGSHVPGSTISYTEAEYEYAQRRGIQTFAYVRADFDEQVRLADQTPEDRERQIDLKLRVESELAVEQDYFRESAQLIEQVVHQIERWTTPEGKRPRFRINRKWPVKDPAAYAVETVRRAESVLFPKPVVLVNMAVASEPRYPPLSTGRMVRKVREIEQELTAKGHQALVFNDLPVSDLTLGTHYEQRLERVRASAALVVCFIQHQSEVDRITDFQADTTDVVVWRAAAVHLASATSPRYHAEYTPGDLSDCTLGLETVEWITREVESQLIRTLAHA
jgi:hypothetical protein